jgi:hypothetical protein
MRSRYERLSLASPACLNCMLQLKLDEMIGNDCVFCGDFLMRVVETVCFPVCCSLA